MSTGFVDEQPTTATTSNRANRLTDDLLEPMEYYSSARTPA
jgi:hypothetical protein